MQITGGRTSAPSVSNGLPRRALGALCAQRIACEAMTQSPLGAQLVAGLSVMPSHVQTEVIEALCALGPQAVDAQPILALGRALPLSRVALWQSVEPARALSVTPLWALLREPEAIAHWLIRLKQTPARLGPMLGRSQLRERVQTFETLRRQGGFDSRVVGDLAELQRCLAALLALLPEDGTWEPAPFAMPRRWPDDDEDDFFLPPRRPAGRRPRWDPVLPPSPRTPWLPFHHV